MKKNKKNTFQNVAELIPFVPQSIPSKAVRSLEEIQKEYREWQAKAGDRQYLIWMNVSELEEINAKMLSLNQEANVAHAKLQADQAQKNLQHAEKSH